MSTNDPHAHDPHGHDPHRPNEQGPREERHDEHVEEVRVSGEAVLAKIKELVREGNVRRITIKNEEGRTLIEIPLTVGVIGTVLLPVWAAIGAVAALAANLTLAVDRRPEVPRDRTAPDRTAPDPDTAHEAPTAPTTTERPYDAGPGRPPEEA